MIRDYISVSTYDKSDNLIRYIEFKKDSQELKNYYKASGNILNRVFVNENNNETMGSVIKFEDSITLEPNCYYGETFMRAVVSGNTAYANASSRIDTCNNDETEGTSVEYFTIKPDLIDEWLNKL